jgi:hypothetical protein
MENTFSFPLGGLRGLISETFCLPNLLPHFRWRFKAIFLFFFWLGSNIVSKRDA